MKRERLNSELERKIAGYVWVCNELCIKTEKLSKLFRADVAEIRRVLNKITWKKMDI